MDAGDVGHGCPPQGSPPGAGGHPAAGPGGPPSIVGPAEGGGSVSAAGPSRGPAGSAGNAPIEGDRRLLMSDDFKMYSFKVLPCPRQYGHAWALCPFAHPSEKARRRDVRVHHYSGLACPDMKKTNSCPRGDLCAYAHNDFEYWLHPQRYRTQLCKVGAGCRRKTCFFAHAPSELRAPTPVVPLGALLDLRGVCRAAAGASAPATAASAGSLAGPEEGGGGGSSGAAFAAEPSLGAAAGSGLVGQQQRAPPAGAADAAWQQAAAVLVAADGSRVLVHQDNAQLWQLLTEQQQQQQALPAQAARRAPPPSAVPGDRALPAVQRQLQHPAQQGEGQRQRQVAQLPLLAGGAGGGGVVGPPQGMAGAALEVPALLRPQPLLPAAAAAAAAAAAGGALLLADPSSGGGATFGGAGPSASPTDGWRLSVLPPSFNTAGPGSTAPLAGAGAVAPSGGMAQGQYGLAPGGTGQVPLYTVLPMSSAAVHGYAVPPGGGMYVLAAAGGGGDGGGGAVPPGLGGLQLPAVPEQQQQQHLQVQQVQNLLPPSAGADQPVPAGHLPAHLLPSAWQDQLPPQAFPPLHHQVLQPTGSTWVTTPYPPHAAMKGAATAAASAATGPGSWADPQLQRLGLLTPCPPPQTPPPWQ